MMSWYEEDIQNFKVNPAKAGQAARKEKNEKFFQKTDRPVLKCILSGTHSVSLQTGQTTNKQINKQQQQLSKQTLDGTKFPVI